jgi:hypothetical protein
MLDMASFAPAKVLLFRIVPLDSGSQMRTPTIGCEQHMTSTALPKCLRRGQQLTEMEIVVPDGITVLRGHRTSDSSTTSLPQRRAPDDVVAATTLYIRRHYAFSLVGAPP